ncbi:MAG: hypothetical protein U0522_02560 [Candidatus Paceibacterota bacterium]
MNYEDYDVSKYKSEKPTVLKKVIRYFGNQVSKLLLVAGLLIIITHPFFKSSLSSTFLPITLLSVVVIVFLAGFTSSKYKWIMFVDVVASAVGFIVFSYQAIITYNDSSTYYAFFLINLIISLLFLFAFYFGVKTIKGWVTNDLKNGDDE